MSLITLTDPRSPKSESYRSLRTNLSFYSLDNPIRTLVVTSPSSTEGKSATAANLAVTMAQSGRRTLLVDCDLRRPSLHTYFSLNEAPGLTNLVLANETEGAPVQETGVDNLWLLASGAKPPNPADLLGSKQLDRIIAHLKESYDFILLDAPPVIAVTDAVVLGAKVDGVLLIISAGKTRRDHAERAKELLEKANARIVGAVLADAPHDASVDRFYG